jgi:dolichol-phosphate mannosyltransferase
VGAQCVLAGLIAELIVSVSAARDRSMTRMQMGASGGPGSTGAPASTGNPGVSSNPDATGVAHTGLPMQNAGYSVSETVGLR